MPEVSFEVPGGEPMVIFRRSRAIGNIGDVRENFSMNVAAEPIYVSRRFRLVIEASIRELLRNAARDERTLPLLENTDHRRRHTLLVKKQLDRAFRLIELLGNCSDATRTTSDRAA